MAIETSGVLAHLKALSPNHIYFLASKAYVLRGYEYYAQGRLESYSWNHSRTILAASVRGSKYYAVTFSVEKGQLVYSCRCPSWTASTQCKHVICALLTTVNLLVPDVFRVAITRKTSQEELSQQLLQGASASQSVPESALALPRFEVTLIDRQGQGGIAITNHGNVCQTFLGMPTELAILLRATQDPAWSVQDALRDFLKHHGQAFPIYFESSQGRTLVEWAPSMTYTIKTELDVHGEEVTVAARSFRFGVAQEHAQVFMGMVVDLDSYKLAPLDDAQGWALYDLVVEHYYGREEISSQKFLKSGMGKRGAPSFRDPEHEPWKDTRPIIAIPLNEFASLQIDLPTQDVSRICRTVQFKIEGQDVALAQADLAENFPLKRYRLTVMPEAWVVEGPLLEPNTASLVAECWQGTSFSGTSEQVFSLFPFLEKGTSVAAGLRTKKRRSALYDTFFQLCRAKTAAEGKKLIKACLRQEEFRPFRIKAEAEEILQFFSAPLLEKTVRLLVHEGHWCVVPNDWAKEAQLYAIPYEIWGPQIFEHMSGHEAMPLSQAALFAGLPECYAKTAEAGIELFFQDKPVATGQWDCSVDARRPPTIDWFELRPEIMCDGVRLEAQEIQTILERGGIMEVDGQVRIVDQNTQEILRAFTALSASKSSKNTDEKKPVVVQVPKLQILDWVALRKRGVRVMLPPDDEALVERLLNFERIEPRPLPKALKATLRPYQQEGYRWLGFLYQHRLGACLADDMGLGKTIQAISLLAGIHEGIIQSPGRNDGPHLVVLPPSLLFNWEQEIARFYPNLTVHTYIGKERQNDFAHADVVLTTYGLVRRDIDVLEHMMFHVILFDEAQAVKNIVAGTTGAARRLKGHFKCVMTGTPLENHVGEYYSLMDLCVPGLLGEYDSIKGKLKTPGPDLLNTIMQRTRPFVLRRTKAQILKELPPKTETDIYLELTDRQKALYQQTVATIRSSIASAYRTKTASQARIIALTAILKLRQICLSPQLLQKDSTDTSPKLGCVVERLQELMDEGHSALVFSQFTSYLDLVEQEFRAHHIPYVRLDGSTPTATRKKIVQEFQDSKEPIVFLLSLKAGGQGLNLTKASYVFHLDPWWNPAVENQASDRAHRIGQKQKVSIMRLLMRHTIEEKMMALKQQKMELYHAVLEGAAHGGGGTSLTQQDFDFLLE
ncbi:MAG: DEAD/DEAH box helicase [Nitrospirota bacterium]|nr:DEAD/DEAH box helicase [Nitrospirota bacterium]